MFTVSEILDLFLTDEIIETMGNWYPRVCAVMSCVIPTMYLAFGFLLAGAFIFALWKVVTGRV